LRSTGEDPVAKTKLLIIGPAEHPGLARLERLRTGSELCISDEAAVLERQIPQAEVLLLTGLSARTEFEGIWRQARSARWIHSLSAGVEKLLIPDFVKSPVVLTNARGVFKRSLAEFAVLGILFHTKKVRRLIDNQRAHRWDHFLVDWANERVMGVVGYGEIGRECALLARGLGLKIHAIRRNPEKSADDPLLDRIFAPEQLHEMLAQLDVLLCAAPLTPQTRHMIGDAEFAVMKPGAIVINVGRGPVIDEAALVRALANARISAASLDVFEHEPLPADSPLWGMPNVLISPHCTDETENPDWLELSLRVFEQNLERYQNGSPLLNVVDKQAGY
jgi:phosphoglycerate dehydrogenase-like enzyme